MVPTIYNYTSESNKYDEYLVLNTGTDEIPVYVIEPVGSWAVDLEDYVSETELEGILSGYVADDELETSLEDYVTNETFNTTIQPIDNAIDELNKAFANYYGKTEIDKLLEGKVSIVEGHGLVLNTEIEKLLTI
jgi:hypothetical protein